MAKMTKSELNNFFNGYVSHLEREGVTAIDQAYAEPSSAKVSAYRSILNERDASYGHSVVGHSCFHFSMGYFYFKDKKVYFVYHTHARRGEMQLSKEQFDMLCSSNVYPYAKSLATRYEVEWDDVDK